MTTITDRYLAEDVENGESAAAQGGIDDHLPKIDPFAPQLVVPFAKASAPAAVPVAYDAAAPLIETTTT